VVRAAGFSGVSDCVDFVAVLAFNDIGRVGFFSEYMDEFFSPTGAA